MKELVVSLLLIAGSAFCFLAALGVLRFPDLFMRMQATTKASTLGIGSLFVALALRFSELDLTARSILVVAFVFITSPVAAHCIARAAYVTKVPMWKGYVVDELDMIHEDSEAPSLTEARQEGRL